MIIDRDYLKSEAKRRRQSGEPCQIKDILALSAVNDPFYAGGDAGISQAQWFADLWERFGYRRGVHLRRVHYQIVSQETPVLQPDGKVYENTISCWQYLNKASKFARYLAYVDPFLFVDRRNPDPIINVMKSGNPFCFHVSEPYGDTVDLPGYYTDIVQGNFQPYIVEVWVEKTTMNDVLLPLCRRYDANLITGAGELSITAVLKSLERSQEMKKPMRILYISDFDPAGVDMPISIARKFEYFQRNKGFDHLDIELYPVALNTDQVKAFRLPRVPVKDSDKRKATFEDSHGEGQVELDALEALHPGKLKSIIEAEILKFYDAELETKIRQEKNAMEAALEEHREKVMARYQEEISAVESMAGDLAAKIYEELQGIEIDMSDYSLPEADISGNTTPALYSGAREYFDQLQHYKHHRNGVLQ